MFVYLFSWRYNPLWLNLEQPGSGLRRRDLYLTTHNTQNRQTSIPPLGFEPTISAGERPNIYALDRAATGTGVLLT